MPVKHLTTSELEAGLADVHQSPKDGGVLEMIVRRPQVGEREILDEGQLDLADGPGRRQLEDPQQQADRRRHRRIPTCSSI